MGIWVFDYIIFSTIVFEIFDNKKRIMFTQASRTTASLHSPSRDVAETIIVSPHYVDEGVEALTG